jgi:hypothetical protein
MKAFGKVNFIEVNRQILTPNDSSVRLFLVKRLWFSLRIIRILFFFFHGAAAPSGPGPPHYRVFTMTLRHATLGRTPLGE